MLSPSAIAQALACAAAVCLSVALHNGPVAWGLGNFVWPRLSAAGSRTAVARVVVEPSGAISACLIPAEIEDSGHPVLRLPIPTGCPPA